MHVVEPTVMADGTKAGENQPASLCDWPPVIIPTTPALTAASTPSARPGWVPEPPNLMHAIAGRVELAADQFNAE